MFRVNEQKTSITTVNQSQNPGMVVHTCNSTVWDVEAGESRIQGHLVLYSEFQTILGYMGLSSKIMNTKEQSELVYEIRKKKEIKQYKKKDMDLMGNLRTNK